MAEALRVEELNKELEERIKKLRLDWLVEVETRLTQVQGELDKKSHDRYERIKQTARTDVLSCQKTLIARISTLEVLTQTQTKEITDHYDRESTKLRSELMSKEELIKLRQDFFEKISTQDKEIDGVLARHLAVVNRAHDNITEQGARISRLEAQENTRPEQNQNRNNNWGTKLIIPKFEGNNKDKPMSYLSQLESFCHAQGLNDRDKMIMIKQSLQGIAREWWEIMEESTDDFEAFKRKFINKFWSDETQRKIRRSLEFGSYYPDGTLSRVEYAIQKYHSAKDFKHKMTEREIVECLSRHYNDTIYNAALTRGVEDLSALITLLEKFDNTRRPNYNKDATQSSSNKDATPNVNSQSNKERDTRGNRDQNRFKTNMNNKQTQNPRSFNTNNIEVGSTCSNDIQLEHQEENMEQEN